jgi:hypothetical protein
MNLIAAVSDLPSVQTGTAANGMSDPLVPDAGTSDVRALTLSTLSACGADRGGTSIGVPRGGWRNQPAKPCRRPRHNTIHDGNFMPLHTVSRMNPVAVNDIRAVYPHIARPFGVLKFTQNRNDAF